MSIEVVKYPSDFLKRSASHVDDNVDSTIDVMIDVMYGSSGVGIAAPQLGIDQRIVIIDPSGGEDASKLLVMINPEITWMSREVEWGDESCLSVPGVSLRIQRARLVDVVYFDREKQRCTLESGDSWESRIIQHEIDHLNGVLIIDKAPQVERNRFYRTLRKNETNT